MITGFPYDRYASEEPGLSIIARRRSGREDVVRNENNIYTLVGH